MCSWKKSWVFWEHVPMLPPFSTLPTPPPPKKRGVSPKMSIPGLPMTSLFYERILLYSKDDDICKIPRTQYVKIWPRFLHERLAFQSLGVWVVDWQQYKHHYLLSFFPVTFFFSVVTFFHRRNVQINFAKVDKSVQKPRGRHIFRPCRPFWIFKVPVV